MNSLNSMKQKLRPLGFYNLNDTSLINAELSAYAEALDIIGALFEEIEQERFIVTAKSYGISQRERTLGSEKIERLLENRRNNLLYRYSISSNDFNKKSIEKVLSVAGINGYIIEVLGKNILYINCLNLSEENTNNDDVKRAIEEFLPAHLECIFDFRSLQWATIDNYDSTFDVMDSKNLTWNDVDNFDEI